MKNLVKKHYAFGIVFALLIALFIAGCDDGSNDNGNGPNGPNDPDVNAVLTIIPNNNVIVVRGMEERFLINLHDVVVDWTILEKDEVDEETGITNTGLLTVSEWEELEEINIRATVRGDPTNFAQVKVTIPPPDVEDIVINLTHRDIQRWTGTVHVGGRDICSRNKH